MIVIKELDSEKVLMILEGESLRRAVLSNQNLCHADLQAVDLHGADLRWVNLSRAQLKGADLSRANLEGANLLGANLAGANLCGANLAGVFLDGGIAATPDQMANPRADFSGAVYDRNTSWPARFDPRQRGARAVEPPASSRHHRAA